MIAVTVACLAATLFVLAVVIGMAKADARIKLIQPTSARREPRTHHDERNRSHDV